MKKISVFISLFFCGLFFFIPSFTEAVEGKTEIEVNILSDSASEQPSEDQSSEKDEKNQTNKPKASKEKKELSVIEKINNLLPKTGSKNQYGFIIFGIILTLMSIGFIIKKALEETTHEKN